jgi:cytochrome c556
MSKHRRSLRIALLPAAAALALMTGDAGRAESASTPTGVDAQAIVFERQQLMTRLSENSEMLGKIAAGTAPADKLAATAHAIAEDAQAAQAAFEQQVPGGRAKPEVWSNWADFSQRLKTFSDNSTEMARIADTGNRNAVMEFMLTALPCKECHDLYREKKH